jgi:hypothetical protein
MLVNRNSWPCDIFLAIGAPGCLSSPHGKTLQLPVVLVWSQYVIVVVVSGRSMGEGPAKRRKRCLLAAVTGTVLRT